MGRTVAFKMMMMWPQVMMLKRTTMALIQSSTRSVLNTIPVPHTKASAKRRSKNLSRSTLNVPKPWYNSANGALEVLKYSNEENVCIPCNKADLPYEESDYMEQYEAQNDGNNQDEEDDNRVQQEVNDICENLY